MIRLAYLRCGALPGELGALEAALSVGVAQILLVPPHGLELRAGVDFSLAGREVSPLLDIYVARIPWRRGVQYDNPSAIEWSSYSTFDSDRIEWRLAIPVGVEFHEPDRHAAQHIVFALIPEITFASRPSANSNASADVAVSQHWAIFLAVRYEVDGDRL